MAKGKKKSLKTKPDSEPKSEEATVPDQPEAYQPQSAFELSDEMVTSALTTGRHRDLLERLFGEEEYEALVKLAGKARSRRSRGGPRVLILPGIMGSKLGCHRFLSFHNTIWLEPLDLVTGGLKKLSLADGRKDIEPLGVMMIAYLRLRLILKGAGFDTGYFPYDWRLSLDQLGEQLARHIRKETSGNRSIYLVCHSMGGLVARMALAKLGDDNAVVRRVIQLGTPNHGSFAPVLALRGKDPMVSRLAALDTEHTVKELITGVFSTFPGLMQLLPFREKFHQVDLYDIASWPDDQMCPHPGVLAAAPGVQAALPQPDERFRLIMGVNRETVVNMTAVDGAFRFETSMEGDGTVPNFLSKCPGLPTYYVEESHGSLANNRKVAKAVIELLESGKTSVLPTSWSASRRGTVNRLTEKDFDTEVFDGRRGKQITTRDVRYMLSEFVAPAKRESAPATANAAGSTGYAATKETIIIGRRRQHRVDLRLAQGSITEVDAHTLVLGLFRDVEPSGAARALDGSLGGAITEFTNRRMFSGNVGEIFMLPTGRYKLTAEMVMFAGMGPFDEFDEDVLRLTAENVSRSLACTRVDSFATVLMGAGSGVGLAESLGSLMEGFIRGMQDVDRDYRARSITICEMDPARYVEIRREILQLATTELFDDIELTVEEVVLPAAPEPVADDRVTTLAPVVDPLYLIVRKIQDTEADPLAGSGSTVDAQTHLALQASVLTSGGKAAVITDSCRIERRALLRHLERIEMSSFNARNLAGFGEKLAQMVLPEDIRTVLGTIEGKRMVVIHDDETSRIPWETLHIDGRFPALADGMSRKYAAADLSVAKWLESRRRDREMHILVVINPTRDLDGAEAEGNRIVDELKDHPLIKTTVLRGWDATWSALNAAFRSGDYDVLHYAGHAYFDPNDRSRSGVICADNRVLSGADLAGLGQLPALVFFNACESGRVRSAARERQGGVSARERIDRNVGLAEAFMRGGVANYVGTYWPVGDAPAMSFAGTFYDYLLRGETIAAALKASRAEVFGLGSVDWADYIHYGGIDFRLKQPE
ncbi:MAG: CHAT domain-containing protein [Acidobacteriota bacterium]|nr:CHAT domain-containing protein [Acidobacteriota bacterium]